MATYVDVLRSVEEDGFCDVKSINIKEIPKKGAHCSLCNKEFVCGEMVLVVETVSDFIVLCLNRPECREKHSMNQDSLVRGVII